MWMLSRRGKCAQHANRPSSVGHKIKDGRQQQTEGGKNEKGEKWQTEIYWVWWKCLGTFAGGVRQFNSHINFYNSISYSNDCAAKQFTAAEAAKSNWKQILNKRIYRGPKKSKMKKKTNKVEKWKKSQEAAAEKLRRKSRINKKYIYIY